MDAMKMKRAIEMHVVQWVYREVFVKLMDVTLTFDQLLRLTYSESTGSLLTVQMLYTRSVHVIPKCL